MSNWNMTGIGAQQGWQCPICGAVYSPFTPMCYNCTGRTKTTTVSTETFEVKDFDEYLNHNLKFPKGTDSDGKDKNND